MPDAAALLTAFQHAHQLFPSGSFAFSSGLEASAALAGTTPHGRVALLQSYDSRWAIDFPGRVMRPIS